MNRKAFFLIITVLCVALVGCQPLSGPGAEEPPAGWLTYTHPKAGFSFAYPPEAKFFPIEAAADSPSYGYAYMVVGIDRIEIDVVGNLSNLSVDEFLVSPQANRYPESYNGAWPPVGYADYITSFQVDGREARQVARSAATLPITGLGKYSTYIANGDLIVVVHLLTAGRNPIDTDWEPTARGADVYTQVIASLRFTQHAQALSPLPAAPLPKTLPPADNWTIGHSTKKSPTI